MTIILSIWVILDLDDIDRPGSVDVRQNKPSHAQDVSKRMSHMSPPVKQQDMAWGVLLAMPGATKPNKRPHGADTKDNPGNAKKSRTKRANKENIILKNDSAAATTVKEDEIQISLVRCR